MIHNRIVMADKAKYYLRLNNSVRILSHTIEMHPCKKLHLCVHQNLYETKHLVLLRVNLCAEYMYIWNNIHWGSLELYFRFEVILIIKDI